EPQDRPIHRRHPLDSPLVRELAEQMVELLEVGGDPQHQLARELGDLPLVARPVGQGVGRILTADVRLEQDVERGPTRISMGMRPGSHFSRVRYSPVRVSTLTRSPSSTNRGTWTVMPVSSVAGFMAPETRSPFTPGSVFVTASTAAAGRSSEIGFPS